MCDPICRRQECKVSLKYNCGFNRVANEFYSMNFSFKCHRETPSTGIANVYSVNAISFHPTFGTFSTAGSDGTFHFWYVTFYTKGFFFSILEIIKLIGYIGTRMRNTASKDSPPLIGLFQLPLLTETDRYLLMRLVTIGARGIRRTTLNIQSKSCFTRSKKTKLNQGLPPRSGSRERW